MKKTNDIQPSASDRACVGELKPSEKLIALTQERATRAHPGMRQYGAHTSWHLREHQISHIRSVSSKPKTKEVNHESNPIIGCGLSHRVVVSRVCGTGVIQQHVGPKDAHE
jgi:hypothetical protein